MSDPPRPPTPPPPATKLPTLIANIDLHAQAQQRAEDYVDEFADSLLLQSKTLALTQKANIVLSTHVDDAHEIISTRAQKRGRLREFLLIAGSAMIGTFLQGFPTEMSMDPIRRKMVVFNVCMGLFGAGLVAWAVKKS